MNGVIYANLPQAQRQCDAIALLLGYPKPGVHVGGGQHVSIPQVYALGAPGWTANEVAPLSHPTLPQFAVPVDPAVVSVDGRQATVDGVPERVSIAAQQTLGVDWFPAAIIVSAVQQDQAKGL